jgi:hypothetical protein
MVADRRASHEPLPFWKKPNWVVPMVVAGLNCLAIVGVAHVTARDITTLRPSDDASVLERRISRTTDTWDLTTFGTPPEAVLLDCEQYTNVTVAVRTPVTTFSAVLCPSPAP